MAAYNEYVNDLRRQLYEELLLSGIEEGDYSANNIVRSLTDEELVTLYEVSGRDISWIGLAIITGDFIILDENGHVEELVSLRNTDQLLADIANNMPYLKVLFLPDRQDIVEKIPLLAKSPSLELVYLYDHSVHVPDILSLEYDDFVVEPYATYPDPYIEFHRILYD